ncbi:hypothetical protein ACWCRF_26520 [Streptomyces sp. NPDC002405]|uniref:hypothetical protein n=1 Tax=unclassified Streptomyces TaxID=2593676 RepID=UPI0011413D3A|nr:hypothetical protein [Streptomyces sp. 6-11-2]GED85531.1 hypothetical protein TNCT6_26160 [Streptomyces sp. 6-11-2]
MFSLIIGIALIAFGVCLIADLGGIATRIHAFFTSFMNPGQATTGTIRLVGVFAALVGVVWVVTSFPLG